MQPLKHHAYSWSLTKLSIQVKIWGVLPSPPLFLFFLPLLFPSFPSSLPCLPLEVGALNAARRSGERCKLPQQALGQSCSLNRISCSLELKSDSWQWPNLVHFKQQRQIGIEIFVSDSLSSIRASGSLSSRSLARCRRRILKHNRRLNQRESLPLNATKGAWGSECGPGAKLSAVGVWGSPQKLKLFAHLHIIFCVFALCNIFIVGERRQGHGPSGPMVNTLVPPRPTALPLPSPPGKREFGTFKRPIVVKF